MLLDSLGTEEPTAVIGRLRPRTFKRGQVVFNDGDRGDCLYLVESGRLEVQVTTLAGQAVTLRVVHPGQFFGELALVHPGNRRMGRVRALEPTQTWVLHAQDFEELRARFPGVDRSWSWRWLNGWCGPVS